MAATIGKVSAVFTASTSGLKSGVKDASSSFKSLAGDVSALKSRMGTLAAIQGAQLFGSIAGAAINAGRSFIGMAQGEAEAIDQTSKLSRRLGMTYGELAGLSLAGDLAGVSMDTIGKAATKADVAFVKAAQGSDLAKKALAGVGLSVDELQNKSPAERFQMMADAIAGLPSPAERARAAIALFGKSGAELLPLFEGGAGSIKKATEEAQRFGLALTDRQGVAVEEMNDSFTRAYASIQGVVQQVVAYLAPAIQGVTDSFTSLIGNIGGTTIGQFIGEGIIAGAQFLASIADGMISGLSGVFEYIGAVGAVWNGVFEFGYRFGAFLAAVGRGIQLGLESAVLGISGTITGVLMAVRDAAALIGLEDSTLNSSISALEGFNQSVMDSMSGTLGAVSSNLNAAFGNKAPGGEKGPLETFLADALAKSRADASAGSVASRTTLASAMASGGGQSSTSPQVSTREALKAIDSRSKEGVAEMYRLMRGNEMKAIAEQQLNETKKTNQILSQSDYEEIADIIGG